MIAKVKDHILGYLNIGSKDDPNATSSWNFLHPLKTNKNAYLC